MLSRITIFFPGIVARGVSALRAPAAAPTYAHARATATPTLAVVARAAGHTTNETDPLRVREGPGPEYAIMGRLAAGESVTAAGRTADARWVYVIAPLRGWVSADYIKLEGGLARAVLPVTWVPILTPTRPLPTLNPALQTTPSIELVAEPNTITYFGQCVDLFWNVENVKEVYLSGDGVNGHGRRSVCPKVSTSYQLHVLHTNGVFEDFWTRVTVAAGQYCPDPGSSNVSATPGPTQTPWIIVVTATPTFTPTRTPTRTVTSTLPALPTRTPTP